MPSCEFLKGQDPLFIFAITEARVFTMYQKKLRNSYWYDYLLQKCLPSVILEMQDWMVSNTPSILLLGTHTAESSLAYYRKEKKKSHHSGLMCPTQMIFQQWFSLYWSFSIIGLWFLLSYCVILHHCGWFSCMTWWLSYFISIVSHL